MKLPELLAGLEAKRDYLAGRGIDPEQVDVVIWDGDDVAPVTDLDYDKFEEDGPWAVEIRKAGDP